jgi:hypothetical protein
LMEGANAEEINYELEPGEIYIPDDLNSSLSTRFSRIVNRLSYLLFYYFSDEYIKEDDFFENLLKANEKGFISIEFLRTTFVLIQELDCPKELFSLATSNVPMLFLDTNVEAIRRLRSYSQNELSLKDEKFSPAEEGENPYILDKTGALKSCDEEDGLIKYTRFTTFLFPYIYSSKFNDYEKVDRMFSKKCFNCGSEGHELVGCQQARNFAEIFKNRNVSFFLKKKYFLLFICCRNLIKPEPLVFSDIQSILIYFTGI